MEQVQCRGVDKVAPLQPAAGGGVHMHVFERRKHTDATHIQDASLQRRKALAADDECGESDARSTWELAPCDGATAAPGEAAGAARDVVFLKATWPEGDGGEPEALTLEMLNAELVKCGLIPVAAAKRNEAAPAAAAALRQELSRGGGDDQPLFVALLLNGHATPEVLEAVAKKNARVVVASLEAVYEVGAASRYVVSGVPCRRDALYPLLVPMLRDGA